MAKQMVLLSDLSGDQIIGGDEIRVSISDKTNGTVHVLDASRHDDLVQQMLSVAQTRKAPGRKTGTGRKRKNAETATPSPEPQAPEGSI